jgi:hypothetical protein
VTAALQCGDTSGFLFSHPCDRLATGQCATCGKPICIEHTRLTATGPRCVSCLRDEQLDREGDDRDRSTHGGDDHDASPTAADQGARHEGGFGGAGATAGWTPEQAAASGTDPHFYGGPDAWAEPYTAADRAAFESVSTPDDPDAGAGGIESDPGGS